MSRRSGIHNFCAETYPFPPRGGNTGFGSPSILTWGNELVTANVASFMNPGFSPSLSGINTIFYTVPTSGTLSRMFYLGRTTTVNPSSIQFDFMVNGVATPLALFVLTGTQLTGSNVTNSISVVAGDSVGIRASLFSDGSSPNGVTVTVQFQPI